MEKHYSSLREKIAAETAERRKRYAAYEALWNEAESAGRAAADACVPTPMVVQQRANMADDSSPVVKSWHVPSGACGFAWVTIRPATSSFARWLKKQGLGRRAYYGGIEVSAEMVGGQSIEIKTAWARAVADVLTKAGIKAHAGSRLD